MRKEIIVNAEDLESRVAILEKGQLAELHVEREARIVGSIYKGRVMSVLPGMDAAFADIGLDKNVFLCADDVGFVSKDGVTVSGAPRSLTISERLKENQEVVVQIVRAPVAAKGARATTRLALPGRYLVLLMYNGRQVGVSRKIEDRKERERLRKIGEKLRPKGRGLIIRTEAEGRGKGDLEADLKVLLDLQDRLMSRAAEVKAPALLHQDLTLVYQVIRDVFSEDVSRLVIDAKSVYDSAVELVQHIAPALRKRIKRYRGKMPIFHKYNVEGDIDRLLRRRVWLRAGGYISIDQAEAFTAIDVNTGRFTGSSGLADTIVRTNLEAAEEIARQLRLRDLGGIIVIDFIDMDRARHRQSVMKTFEEALKRDRQKTKIVHLSPLGLLEMTRKRRGESLMGIITEICPHCGGLGRVRRRLTVALKVEREVRRIAAEDKPEAISVRVAPSIAALLIGEGGELAANLQSAVEIPVYIRAEERFGLEEDEVVAITAARAAARIKTYSVGDEVVVSQVDPEDSLTGEEVHGWCDGYRVQFTGLDASADTHTVVLAEAGDSLGRGNVKGTKPKSKQEAPAKKRPRRRGGRKRSASSRKETQEAAGSEPASGTAPSPAEKKPSPPAEVVREPDKQSAPEIKPTAKRRGLLRRGSRQITRPRR